MKLKIINFLLYYISKQRMQTIMFIIDIRNPSMCGYQLTSHTFYYHYRPNGRIHIARFSTAFDPKNGLGYLGDIYMRNFIRKWKNKVITKKKRRIEIINTILCLSNKNNDLVRYICSFL